MPKAIEPGFAAAVPGLDVAGTCLGEACSLFSTLHVDPLAMAAAVLSMPPVAICGGALRGQGIGHCLSPPSACEGAVE